ncbi:MAG: class I SAM-dependent methyltransferase [Rubrimonas sp.]|uniref:class I SAM-dependent methyltransferase n=1 Tax=Rubrimonas sp. TaxID=2036015 RepID=UPI002FDD56A8
MADGSKFWDRIADRYAARAIRDAGAYDAAIARTRAHLKPCDHVLELGCGTGTTALRLADAAARIDATDFSTRMIEIATGKARAAGVASVAFSRADLTDPAAAPGPYDAVLAFNLLQLMPDLPAALALIAARVKPGGVFVSKSVCLGEPGWRRARIVVGALRAVGIAPPLRFLRITALDAAIERAGFEIVERGMFPERPPGRFLVARRVA